MHMSKTTRGLLGCLVGALGAMVLATQPFAAGAAEYPTRPITMIVPFSPGGSTDLLARVVTKEIDKLLGQPIIIENKPGAATMRGLNEIVAAKPDGYTLGFAGSTMIFQPLYGQAPHNYPEKLQAIAQVNQTWPILAVNAEKGWKSVKEFVAYAKDHPDAIKYGVTGFGNTAHLGPAELARQAGVQMKPVTFQGGAPLIAALLGGHIDAGAGSPVDYKEHIQAGKLNGLVSFGDKRSSDPVLANIPTAREAGYDVEIVLWQGIFGPKGMPPEVLKKLADTFATVLARNDVKDAIRELGIEPVYMGAEEWGKKWLSDQERMRKIVTETGILEIVKSQTK